MSKVLQIWLIAAPPAGEIRHHRLRHRRRISRNALGDDAVVAGEDGDQRVQDMRPGRGLPAGHEGRNLLEPPERPGRLGELSLPLARRGCRRLVRPRHLQEEGADVVEGGRAAFMRGSRRLEPRPYSGIAFGGKNPLGAPALALERPGAASAAKERRRGRARADPLGSARTLPLQREQRPTTALANRDRLVYSL